MRWYLYTKKYEGNARMRCDLCAQFPLCIEKNEFLTFWLRYYWECGDCYDLNKVFLCYIRGKIKGLPVILSIFHIRFFAPFGGLKPKFLATDFRLLILFLMQICEIFPTILMLNHGKNDR